MAFLAAQGQDVLFVKESVKLGSRFANKIWNASRYLLRNLEGRTLLDPGSVRLSEVDRWIGHRLNRAAGAAREALEGYRFNEAAQAVYEFFWNDFCDWYLEAAKLPLLTGDDAEKDRVTTLLVTILEESLRLVHPFLPLITEEIWQKLPILAGGRYATPADGVRSIMIQPYPAVEPAREDAAAEGVFSVLQELVRAVRTIRSEFTIPPDSRIDVTVVVEGELRRTFEAHRELVAHLAGTKTLAFQADRPTAQGCIPSAGRGFEVFVHVRGAIDVPRETARLGREREKTLAERQRTEAKLANAAFLERAPAEVVERERSRLAELAERVEKIDGYLATLGA